MSNYKGKNLNIEIFGGSHDDHIGAKVYGLPKFDYNYEKLGRFMLRRKPKSDASTSRKESDELLIEKLDDGATKITIKNTDVKRSDYDKLYGKPRPSHADYCTYIKDGTLDFSGGGRFSGRMTAALCAVGGLCLQYLESKGIRIAAYLYGAGGVYGDGYRHGDLTTFDIENRRGDIIPSLSNNQDIFRKIEQAKNDDDSVGGAVDCVIEGKVAGLGDCIFDGLESKLSALMFAIPAVKAVEFGAGTALSEMTGSAANDQMSYEDGKVVFASNNSGGIYGGIASGNRITMSVTFKPTPSIKKAQNTVDLVSGKNCVISVDGRHDACVAIRAVPVVESMAAIGVLDEWLSENG